MKSSNAVTPLHAKNIIFYFPYRGVGGVSTLFLRLANLLAKQRAVFVVDFIDGYMARNLPQNVKLIPFGGSIPYPENSVFVLQSVPLWNLLDHQRIPMHSRFLLWNLFPYNINPNLFLGATGGATRQLLARFCNVFSFPRRRKLNALIDYLLSCRALLFMDGENLSTLENLFCKRIFNSTFMPVITDAPPEPTWQCGQNHQGPVQAAWIGRIEDFKVPILKHLLMRLDAVASNVPTTLTIVGTGSALDELKVLAATASNLKIVFSGELSLATLSNFLTNEVDILFAMGTSALEGAKLGVPTILLDYSYSEIRGLYRFRYIFAVREHTLGEEIKERHLESRCTLYEILEQLRCNQEIISLMCRAHWEHYHSPSRWIPKFIEAVDNTDAVLDELRRLDMFSPDWATKLFKRTRNRFLTGKAVAGIKSE